LGIFSFFDIGFSLIPFLPSHDIVDVGDGKGGAVSAAPFGSSSILPISHIFIKLMGAEGLKKAGQMAILNANYLAKRLEKHYKILYTGKNGFVAHEFILDLKEFKPLGIESEDIAKRLMDYNFHAPTQSFPVVNTLMVEPTESESKDELDRLADALISIREEVREIEEGKVKVEESVLKHSPHPQTVLLQENWDRKYSREKAAYPLPSLKKTKVWPTVGRIDNAFGDRNLICSCPPIESYEQK